MSATSKLDAAAAIAAALSHDDRFKLIIRICETFNSDPSLADLDTVTERALDDTLATIVMAAEDAPDLTPAYDPDAGFWAEADYRYEMARDERAAA